MSQTYILTWKVNIINMKKMLHSIQQSNGMLDVCQVIAIRLCILYVVNIVVFFKLPKSCTLRNSEILFVI
jgi:hypothetical protein